MPNPTVEKLYEGIEIARNHNVDFIIGMDIISKGALTIRNNNGKTEVEFSI